MPATAKSVQNISQTAFKGVIGALFGLAILFAAARTYIRIRKFRRLFVDDAFLLVAVLALIVSTALTFVFIPYLCGQVGAEADVQAIPADMLQQLILDQRYLHTSAVFTWTALYAVKFSFLFFFRNLICRLRTLTIIWWCVFSVVVVAYGGCAVSTFVACSTFGPGVVEFYKTPESKYRQGVAIKYSVAADVITDAMIICIPIILLYRIRISLRQKLSLMALLSLSIFMIVFAVIRVVASSGDVNPGVIFWFEVETLVAVIMVSMSAFRTLFVEHAATRRSPSPTTAVSRKKNPSGRTAEITAKTSMTLAPSLGFHEVWGRADSKGSAESEDMVLPLEGPMIQQPVQMHHVNKSYDPSCDSQEV